LSAEPARIEVEVNVGEGLELPCDPESIERAVLAVLHAEAIPSAEISLTFLPDREIARLNEEYRSHDGPTDVLSFPLKLESGPPLGDVYIGLEQAQRQAAELGVPLTEELLRLAVHGTLHILGYEHPEDDERLDSPMYRRQEALLETILERIRTAG
jgi:probable rRNA maturation factor